MPTQIGARHIPAKTLYEISLGISSLTKTFAAGKLDDIERVSAEFHVLLIWVAVRLDSTVGSSSE